MIIKLHSFLKEKEMNIRLISYPRIILVFGHMPESLPSLAGQLHMNNFSVCLEIMLISSREQFRPTQNFIKYGAFFGRGYNDRVVNK